MDPVLRALLLDSDVEGAWEHPPEANWQRAIAEVEQLKPQLEEALGFALLLDQGVQDASFFADLGLLAAQPAPNGVIVLAYEICFRFSWFGRLYTVHGNDWNTLLTDEAQLALTRAGFVYVSEDTLQEPYDGVNIPFETGLTWWTRYFDYL